MALNASGAISLAGSVTGESIALELGQSATGVISLNDTAVRGLAAVPSGAITMPTSFWGASNIAITGYGMSLGKQAYISNIIYGNGYIISGGPGAFMAYSTNNGATWASVAFPIGYDLSKAYVDASAWYLVIYISTSSAAASYKMFRCPFSSSPTVVANWIEITNFAAQNQMYYLANINGMWFTAANSYVTNLQYKTSYSGTFANCNLPAMVAYYPGIASYYGLVFGNGNNLTSFAYNGPIILILGTKFDGTNTTYYILTSSDNGINWTETSTGLVLSGADASIKNVSWDSTSSLFYATAYNATTYNSIYLVSTTSAGTSWTQYTSFLYSDTVSVLTNSGGTPFYIYAPNRINRSVANTTPASSQVFDLINGTGSFAKTASNFAVSGISIAYSSSFSGASATWAQSASGQQYTYNTNYWTNAGLTLASSSLGHFAVYGGYANSGGGLNAENGVHYSSNNGASWTSTSLGSGEVALYGIAASDIAVVVNANGNAFRSTNGTTWASISPGSTGGIIALGGASGVMVSFSPSAGSNAYGYSTNSGGSWSTSNFGGTYAIKCGCATGSQITLFSQDGSGVNYYHKTSNGSSWTTSTVTGIPAYADIQGGAVSIQSTSVVTLLTFSYGFKIWVSTDGGLNFTQYNTNGGYGNFVQQLGYGSMTLCTDGSAYVGVAASASGYGNALYKSTNGINYTEYGLGPANTSFLLAGAIYKSGQTASLTNNNYVVSYRFDGNRPTSVGYLSS